ncbi:UNVERIFIED_CONTAM: hypothetical protein PYX00_005601 [Menopon gallinae]|uniref:Probable Ufm1-specific protease 2 n=1 Tax=Menopon gallinae TaxID=328185 RepID=A0AAW2HS78_9NEOP
MSQARLKISSLVIERLQNIRDWSEGHLFGIKDDVAFTVLGFCLTKTKTPSENEDKPNSEINFNHNIIPNLPANINILGEFIVSPSEDVITWEKKCMKTDSKTASVLLIVDLNTHGLTAKLIKDKKCDKTEYDVIGDSYWKKLVNFYIKASVTLSCVFDYENVQSEFSTLKKKISQGAAFKLKDDEVYILENNISGAEINDKMDVEQLQSTMASNVDNVLYCNMFLKNISDSGNPEIAPVIKYEKKSFKSAKINLTINALSVVDPKHKATKLYEILVESVQRCIQLNEECLLTQLKYSDPNKISLPQICHFFPQKCGHFVTIAYPKKQMEDQLVSTREVFHKVLSLPMDLPMFRRGNVYSFVKSEDTGIVLTNPHEGLKPSGVQDGEVSLVQGIYGYHHYMQDGFDDNGWGCAYRSLQTIFSWFRYQGFTGKPIPTHKEIQQCLVDIGDKPSSFVGSKNWIGSTEVSFVLDTLLSVSSRIVSVSSGEELSMKGGELSHHFKTQGTPVMIGGGVLAHTILGVDYNRKTGALKFLVLDPHYTGDEDLSVIQSKGWCGWKGLDFWKKNAFYNMCLPIRPKSI